VSSVAITGTRPSSSWRDGLRYGAPGLPLAFVALPLYVLLPAHYAAYGVPLAWLGAVLLGARLLDAVADPWIGRWADRLLARSARQAWWTMAAAAVLLGTGFAGLFHPATTKNAAFLLAWCAALLAVSYLAYSVMAVIHQAWGARLGGDERERAAIVGWREALAVAGVLLASVLPSAAGLGTTVLVFQLALVLALWALRRAPAPQTSSRAAAPASLRLPWQTPAFRRLMAVYLLNGIASAIPATLVLFFIRDRLQAPAQEPLFLAAYFAAAACAIPLWVRAVGRHGLARSWLAGMLLAVIVFVWAAALGPGDALAYAGVCVLSGVALGADLSLPAALLTGVVQQAGHAGHAEGAYFGWWNFATKLNLALAAGLALPALQAFGYAPGTRDANGLAALTLAYCALPCVLKLAAASLLWRHWIRRTP
jgi:Na+/melibiose symporter-like transporter